MEFIQKAAEKIGNGWKWLTTPFRWVSAKIGGTVEKRNLVGSMFDLVGGIVKLPGRAIYGISWFAVMAFQDPKNAFQQTWFHVCRGGRAFGAMFHVVRRGSDGGFRFDMDRLMLVVAMWLLVGYGAMILAVVGMGFLVPWLMLAVLVGFVATGMPAAKAVWNEASYEDHVQASELRETEAANAAINSRIDQTIRTAQAAEEQVSLAQQYAAIVEMQAQMTEKLRIAQEELAAAKADVKYTGVDHQIDSKGD